MSRSNDRCFFFTVSVTAIAMSAMMVGQSAKCAPSKELKPMLKIKWTEGPEYPMGIQESACGVLQGAFVSAGGFTRHPKDIVKAYPDAFGGAANGFTSLTFLFDPLRVGQGWARIADIPGPARQAAASAVVRDALYAIGGFNYAEPLTYRSTYRLQKVRKEWVWTELECKLPWPVCEASAVVVGTKIYLVASADYFAAPGSKDPDFHSEAGRDGNPVGRALLVLDTRNLKAGWKRLADLPGAPQFDAAVAAAGGRIYLLGGIYSPLQKIGQDPYLNAVDSWVYDVKSDKWSQLPDMPDGANRRAVVFKDRFIILISGYKYGRTWHPGNTVTEVYTDEEKKLSMKDLFQKTVLVYDTKTNQLGTADPLLDQTSWPGGAIHGDTVYCLGGEGGSRLWHPATFQIGKIEELRP